MRQISVGEEVNAVLNFGDEKLFDLTAPRDGILVVRLSFDPQEGWAGLTVENRRFFPYETPKAAPISVKLPVVAGRTYRIGVWDPTFWEFSAPNVPLMPFVLTTAIEPTPPSGCNYSISLTGDFENLGDSSQFAFTSGGDPIQGVRLWLIAPAGCWWTAESSAPFVTFQRNRGVGTGGFSFWVAPNFTARARTATVRIADQSIVVTQGRGVSIVDFNDDAHVDLVWHNRVTGLLSTWLMTGTDLSEGARLSPERVPDTDWEPVGSGDLNGDGHADLVWQNKADGRISAWLMEGLQKTDAALLSIPQVPDLNWRVRALTDADGDGRADIFWQHTTQGLVAVWLMNGFDVVDGSLIQAPKITDLDWRLVGVSGEQAGDALTLHWQHEGDGRLAIWLVSEMQLMSGGLTGMSVPDTNWKIRAMGDLNRDGLADYIWRHEADGRLSVWLGRSNSNTVNLGTVADGNWQLVGPR